MGFVVGTTCYAAEGEAHAAYFGNLPGSAVPSGTSVFETDYVPASSVGRTSPSGWTRATTEYPAAGGAALGVVYEDMPVPGLPACDPVEGFSDGLAVGWGIAAALVLVAAIRLLQRGTG